VPPLRPNPSVPPLAWRLPFAFALLFSATLAACGGGGDDPAPSNSSPAPAPAPAPTPAPGAPSASSTLPDLPPCAPSGIAGTADYQIGPGKLYAELNQIPWSTLQPGDTVRIFHRTQPYKTKFLLAAQGTADKPVRICGVRGANGERPIIDGNGATTPDTLTAGGAYGTAANDIHQTRSIIVIKALASQPWTAYPRHIQIDGLAIRGAHPSYRFTDAAGTSRAYETFGACIWLDRGHDITIADNQISDCQMAIFSRSTDDGDFAVTKNLRVAGNRFNGNGIVDDWFEHTTYLQSVNLLLEFNRYGPMRSGATGNQHKDRSVGSVIRYNYIEGGAHNLDLVEAEDYPATALADPAYRRTFVYGNILKTSSAARAAVHYGGDHFGSTPGGNWGEPLFRKGTLYFFHNTVYGTSSGNLFRISTTEETVEAWNNVFHFEGTPRLRTAENDGVGGAWISDGILNLGRNWINANWQAQGPYETLRGSANGTANLVTGSAAPIDPNSFAPLDGSVVRNAAVAGPAAADGHRPLYQFNVSADAISARPATTALGARE